MADVAAGALLGLSLGNVWICALVVFALRTSDRAACGGYLVGRFVGVLGFASVFWLIGGLWHPSYRVINILSAVVMLLFVAYFVMSYRFGWSPFGSGSQGSAAGAVHEVDHSDCDHDCAACPVHDDEEMKLYCSDCREQEKACSAEDAQVSALTLSARRRWGRPAAGEALTGFFSGFTLGALRGSAMCGRMMVLLPLVISGTLSHALAVGSAFAFASTLYPVLGMLLGGIVLKAVPHRRFVFDASAVMLFAVAGLYMYRGVTASF